MSSANRGYQRHKDDFYVTPQKHITKFLRAFFKNYPISSFKKILDPCAGGSERYPMAYPNALMEFLIDEKTIITNDIRQDSLAEFKGDYLDSSFVAFEPNLIISNPPFSLAKEFVLKAIQDINANDFQQGLIVFFLRYSFLASKDRFNFFQEYMPTEIYLHHDRPSFIPEDIIREDGKVLKAGSTDSTEYAHFVWDTRFTKRNSTKSDSINLYLI